MQELTQIQRAGYAETGRFDTVECEHLNSMHQIL